MFNENVAAHDKELPKESLVYKLRGCGNGSPYPEHQDETRPQVLFCITMYQEEWYQILQSVAGCIRAILELEESNSEKYSHEKFAIILIAGKVLEEI